MRQSDSRLLISALPDFAFIELHYPSYNVALTTETGILKPFQPLQAGSQKERSSANSQSLKASTMPMMHYKCFILVETLVRRK